MKVFVEFVGSVFFVDLKLSQNPFMPTTCLREHQGVSCPERCLSMRTSLQTGPIPTGTLSAGCPSPR